MILKYQVVVTVTTNLFGYVAHGSSCLLSIFCVFLANFLSSYVPPKLLIFF
jgi:hypothetical protein